MFFLVFLTIRGLLFPEQGEVHGEAHGAGDIGQFLGQNPAKMPFI